ncbi:MAG TPA: DNA sulfur modification protein DndE [Pyrinomonadaceae bacterium]|jgi:DNA sulfur modification protein DndE
MSLNRIHVGKEVDQALRNMKGRTGLTPNLLCRLGFCLSLTEPEVPKLENYADGQSREFNRSTLTGSCDAFYFALLRERMTQDGLAIEEHLEDQFKAHLSRGVLLLAKRLRNLADIADLISEAEQRADAAAA